MSETLSERLARAKVRPMSMAERESQRRSFAYGSAKIENDRITRDTIARAEADLKRERESADR